MTHIAFYVTFYCKSTVKRPGGVRGKIREDWKVSKGVRGNQKKSWSRVCANEPRGSVSIGRI